jgi:hypothetical protein
MSIRLAVLELMAAHRRDLAPSFFRKKKKQLSETFSLTRLKKILARE